MFKDVQKSIYVVDDDQGILDSFDAVFGDDYPLVLVDSGSKALEMLKHENPELMFLDIKMPGLNGLDLLARIKEEGLATKVVIVTALPQDKYEEIARQYGVYRYLKKPFDLDEVENIAKTVLH
jgi:two-component system response regulator (stage 0 sporulation protein F)